MFPCRMSQKPKKKNSVNSAHWALFFIFLKDFIHINNGMYHIFPTNKQKNHKEGKECAVLTDS